MTTATASARFTAAHAAAKIVTDFALIYSYRQRFAFALKAIYAAEKAPKSEAGEVQYLLADPAYFGGQHTVPLTLAQICALAETERTGSSKAITVGRGGHAACLFDMDWPFARLAA